MLFTPTPDKGVALQAADGEMYVVTNPGGTGIFHRPAGAVLFTQCYGTNSSNAPDLSRFDATFFNPGFDKSNAQYHGHLMLDEGVAKDRNDTIFERIEMPVGLEYEPLPTTRQPDCLILLRGGLYGGSSFYSSALVFDGFYPMGGRRTYLGALCNMQPREIVDVRFSERNPSASYIATNAVTVWHWADPPRWTETGGRYPTEPNADRLDPNDFDIVETEESATITRKVTAPT